MEWTSQEPTVPGAYWVVRPHQGPVVVMVESFNEVRCPGTDITFTAHAQYFADALWYGPLPVPAPAMERGLRWWGAKVGWQ